jgi:outer membrane lipoprotein-sorting protein
MPRNFYSLISVCLLFVLTPGVFADKREELRPIVEKALKVASVEKLQSLRAWSIVLKVIARHENLHTGTRRIFVQLPDQYRLDFESSKVLMDDNSPVKWSIVLNGRKGWRNDTGQTEEISAEEVSRQRVQLQLQPSWSRYVARLRDPSYQQASIPETTVGGKTAVGVELTHEERPPVRLYFDKETALLLKVEGRQKDGQKGEITFSDYRDVGGIQVPHKWEWTTDGNQDYERPVEGVGKVRFKGSVRKEHWIYEMTCLKFEDKLDAKLFEKP